MIFVNLSDNEKLILDNVISVQFKESVNWDEENNIAMSARYRKKKKFFERLFKKETVYNTFKLDDYVHYRGWIADPSKEDYGISYNNYYGEKYYNEPKKAEIWFKTPLGTRYL